ncbi:MAG: hypothetical protein RRB13_11125 [bacterium]|nr:hypothetical protein [bacterium]
MYFNSPLFWVLMGLVVVVMALRNRSKARPVEKPDPGVSMEAVQLFSPLNRQTPLACLMSDGVKYGVLFEEKEPPDLPHAPGCQCISVPFKATLNALYRGKGPDETPSISELGELSGSPKRYYKCRLIARHPDASPAQRAEYSQLALEMRVAEDFRTQVDQLFEGET